MLSAGGNRQYAYKLQMIDSIPVLTEEQQHMAKPVTVSSMQSVSTWHHDAITDLLVMSTTTDETGAHLLVTASADGVIKAWM